MSGRAGPAAAVACAVLGALAYFWVVAETPHRAPDPGEAVASDPAPTARPDDAPPAAPDAPDADSETPAVEVHETAAEIHETAAEEVALRRPNPALPPLTEKASEEEDMRDLPAAAADYDAPTEARQRFRAMELDAIADRPLTPAKWRTIQSAHADEALDVLKRAKALTDEEEPEAARELMVEWQRLTSLYRNEAYGRGEVFVDD